MFSKSIKFDLEKGDWEFGSKGIFEEYLDDVKSTAEDLCEMKGGKMSLLSEEGYELEQLASMLRAPIHEVYVVHNGEKEPLGDYEYKGVVFSGSGPNANLRNDYPSIEFGIEVEKEVPVYDPYSQIVEGYEVIKDFETTMIGIGDLFRYKEQQEMESTKINQKEESDVEPEDDGISM